MLLVRLRGFRDIVDEEQAKAPSIRGYVRKPAVTRDLAMAVRRLLDQNGTSEALSPEAFAK